MFRLSVEKIDKVAIVHCEGRIVQSDAALQLRSAVTGQRDVRIILLDLAGVSALEGGGLGMVLFLHVWTREHDIQLKVTDPIARVRESLERMRSTAAVNIEGIGEALSMLGWGPEELWDSSRIAA